MSACLLDVNVLIALIDAMHVNHRRAMDWFTTSGREHWMTCPTTQNGAIRIVSGTRYAQPAVNPSIVAGALQGLLGAGRHVFVADSLSLLDKTWITWENVQRASQVTDSYLLALAASNGATLATFDQRIDASTVRNGRNHLLLIP